MTGTAAKSFAFIDCNLVDGDQTYKHTQQSFKRSHVRRDLHCQSRAKRPAALKADDELIVLPKIRSCEIGVQNIAAQPVTKKYFLEPASQASGHVDSDQNRSSPAAIIQNTSHEAYRHTGGLESIKRYGLADTLSL